MIQKPSLGSWINIGNTSAVVCQHYNSVDRVMVVYLQNKQSIARDVIHSNGKWEFEYPDPDGWHADHRSGIQKYVSILKANRFPR